MKITLNSQIFTGAMLGLFFGMILGHSNLPTAAAASWLSVLDLFGRIFINLLKMIVIPLVFVSITAGIANLKRTEHSYRIWPTLILYSMTTTGLAVITGLVAMNLIKPGAGLYINFSKDNSFDPLLSSAPGFIEFFRRLADGILVPPVTAMSRGNILAVVAFAIFIGAAVVVQGNKAKYVLNLINELFEIVMLLVRWIMKMAPLGIMGLLAKLVAQADIQMLYVLGKYILVVVAATSFHGLVTLPLILIFVAKRHPRKFFIAMKEALVTALSTSSSAATLPVSLRCITENLKVNHDIARFVLPVGSSLNMDGTALYEAMAALFIANLCGMHLGLVSQAVVAVTAMAVSIGAPGIPSAGMVTLVAVLQAVGLPAGALVLLIAIDRPLDTIRTVVNVEGDCIGACVVQKLAK